MPHLCSTETVQNILGEDNVVFPMAPLSQCDHFPYRNVCTVVWWSKLSINKSHSILAPRLPFLSKECAPCYPQGCGGWSNHILVSSSSSCLQGKWTYQRLTASLERQHRELTLICLNVLPEYIYLFNYTIGYKERNECHLILEKSSTQCVIFVAR